MNFTFLQSNFTALIISQKTDHLRIRECPRLATKITNIFYQNPCFLKNLSTYRLFKCFTYLHKTCKSGIHSSIRVIMTLVISKQYFFATSNRYNNRWTDYRISSIPAVSTLHSELFLNLLCFMTALSTEFMGFQEMINFHTSA